MLDLSSIASLVYCVAHLIVLYSCQFSFTPSLDAMDGGIDWAQLTGLSKYGSTQTSAVGPVLVFFAVLFRAKTKQAPKDVDSNSWFATTIAKDASFYSWKTFVTKQVLQFGGFEVFVLVNLINLSISAHVASGAVLFAAIFICLSAGRFGFFGSYQIRVMLYFCSVSIFLFELLLRINATHHIWDQAADEWAYWGLQGRPASMFLGFCAIAALHALWFPSLPVVREQERLRSSLLKLPDLADYVRSCRALWQTRGAVRSHKGTEETAAAASLLLIAAAATDEETHNHHENGYEAPYHQRQHSHLTHCCAINHNNDKESNDDDDDANLNTFFPLRDMEDRLLKVIVPEIPSNDACTCYQMVIAFCVQVLCFTSPVAFLSFGAGTVRPCLVNIALLLGGLLQFSYQEEIYFRFYRWWPRIAAAYTLLLCALPVIFNVPYVADWVRDHAQWPPLLGCWNTGLMMCLHTDWIFRSTSVARLVCVYSIACCGELAFGCHLVATEADSADAHATRKATAAAAGRPGA